MSFQSEIQHTSIVEGTEEIWCHLHDLGILSTSTFKDLLEEVSLGVLNSLFFVPIDLSLFISLLLIYSTEFRGDCMSRYFD